MYALVPNELIEKLEDKSQKSIFISNSDATKGYLLFDPVTKKVIISRGVTFD